MTKIICATCKKEIKTREELAVVGRAFVPYHRRCFKQSKGVYKFFSGYPINSRVTWVLLGLINTALWSAYFFFDAPYSETLGLSLFSVILFAGLRLVAYLAYEIRLPKKRS